VRAWYGSVALSSYHADIQPALKALVKSVGTGPWLAGLWWGDSQLGWLAVWLGHAIAAPTWAGREDESAPISVDYYVYSAFTENPGNQCYVNGGDRCRACLSRCLAEPLPASSYWLPKEAYINGGSCVSSLDDCGEHGLEEVAASYVGASAAQLWADVERKLAAARGSVSHTVFDMMLPAHVETDNPAGPPLFP